MSEPNITINGTQLTAGQAMTVRCALESLWGSLEEGLGDDDHGQFMTAAYRERISEIRGLIFGSSHNTGA